MSFSTEDYGKNLFMLISLDSRVSKLLNNFTDDINLDNEAQLNQENDESKYREKVIQLLIFLNLIHL
jgi:hypothetical protein